MGQSQSIVARIQGLSLVNLALPQFVSTIEQQAAIGLCSDKCKE